MDKNFFTIYASMIRIVTHKLRCQYKDHKDGALYCSMVDLCLFLPYPVI